MATIEARVTAVEQEVGSDWYRIALDHPQVKRADTKDRERAQQAVAARDRGGVVVVDYTQRDSRNINPHTNRPYVNYYFNGILDNGAAGQANDGIAIVQPEAEKTWKKMDPSEAWRICLATGAKLAVQTMPLMPTEQRDFETQKKIATAWALWIFQTALPVGSEAGGFAQAVAGTPSAYTEPETYEQPPPPPSDDDIPF